MKNLRSWIHLCLLAALSAPFAISLDAISTTIVISEFRTRGPLGGNDEFVELHNLSSAPIDIGGWKIRASNAAGTVGTRVTINAGTILGPGCFFLATNSAASGYSGSVAGNQTYSTGFTDDGGLAVTLPNDTVVDAVGMSSTSAFKEGTPLSPTTTNADRGIERRPGGIAGHDVDTDNNTNDFRAISPGNPQNLGSTCIVYGDDATVSVDDVSVTEGDAGQVIATFTVTATGVHTGITFDIAAADGAGPSAATVANNDFNAAAAVGSIPAGQTTFTFNVAVNGDVAYEPNETYSVVLSNVNGAGVAKGIGVGTITNDDPAPPVVSDVVISQVYGGGGNQNATLTNDFIELFNRSTSPINLNGWSVQYVSAAGSGTWAVTPLSGTIAPGRYFLIQLAAGQGGSVSLPAPDATGTLALGSTSGKVALQMNTTPITGACPLSNTADLVGYGSGATCSETAPIDPSISNTTAALRKRGGCFDTNNNDVDFSIGNPSPRNSASPANSCTPATLTIGQIQGNALVTPYANQFVATSGVVTATKSNGFYMQMPAPGDNDAATSDGIFVFTQSAPAVTPGNAVLVQGTAGEFFQLTQIDASLPGDVTVQSADALPAPIALTPQILDGTGVHEQLEPLEGMRVSAASLTSVAPTNEFGEIETVLTGVPRPMREPGVSVFDPVPVDPSSGVVDCCIPRFDENPERIMVDSDALGLSPLSVTSNVLLANVVGPLDFSFNRYKIAVETTPSAGPNMSAVAAPVPAAGEFTVAGYNIENFTGGEPQLSKAALAIRQLMHLPDVIGHIEILNQPTLQLLADRVNADAVAAGLANPGYQAVLIPYTVPGQPTPNTQNVGFLVKTSRVRIDQVTQELAGDTFIDPTDGSTDSTHDRPPLVLRATFDFNGANPTPMILVINHLRSFIDIELLTGAGPRVRAKRTAQAESLSRLLQQLQTDNPGVPVLSLGDYNAFQFNDGYTDPISVLKGEPTPDDQIVVDGSPDVVDPNYLNLTDSLPPSERYSFVFEGTPQALDHVLVNTAAAPLVQRYAVVRANADFPEVPASLYAADPTRPERSSDHDMPIAYLRLPDVTAPVISNVPADITGVADSAAGAVVTFATPTAIDNQDGIVPVSCVPASGSQFAIGSTTVTCTATDASGNSASASFMVTITDPRTPGKITGGGRIVVGTTTVNFELEASEAATEFVQFKANIRQNGVQSELVAVQADSVFFNADGSVTFSGQATLNGVAGYTFEVRAADHGEPGRNDTFALVVKDASGVTVV
ncbi:MAG TPA: lamin tail domain-containing protein, partial [Vicinamibacterales bacterium]|nr:lamin tail domain-containing protein [Vicinamibacterales bacterium]